MVKCAVATYAAVTAVTSTAAPLRSAASTCNPVANVLYPNSDYQARGSGIIFCDGSSAPSYWFTIRLVNLSGNILAQNQNGPLPALLQRNVATDSVGCRGAIVHSFLYLNVGGVGKSDTSGHNSDRAY